MDSRLIRIAVGLALETAIVHRRETEELTSLFSDPDQRKISKLHKRLTTSDDSYDREIAIWLELALESSPLKSDPRRLAAEMREMESVLLALISRRGRFEPEMNHWMNLIANAHQFLQDGYWIDAKIMLSRAVQVSKAASIEEIMSTPEYRYEIDVLQRASESYFEEVKRYPLRLNVPEESLEPIIQIQGVMLELMKKFYEEGKGDDEALRSAIQRLSSAIRHLMEKKTMKAEQELSLASRYLDEWLGAVEERGIREPKEDYYDRIKKALILLSPQDS